MSHTATPSIDVRLPERIEQYQHPDLVDRLCRKLGLNLHDAKDLFGEVKHFLYQCSISDTPLSPTERVDEGWHNFILYTKDYAVFCGAHFGRFIHHVPLAAAAGRCSGNYCKGCSHGVCSGKK